MIVSLLAGWRYGCSKCQLNPSLEQEIIANPTRAVNNEYIDSNESNQNKRNNETNENNVYNAYNESFESNEYDQYDKYNQYDEYNQYEPYRQRNVASS